jgi:hypothetical protein
MSRPTAQRPARLRRSPAASPRPAPETDPRERGRRPTSGMCACESACAELVSTPWPPLVRAVDMRAQTHPRRPRSTSRAGRGCPLYGCQPNEEIRTRTPRTCEDLEVTHELGHVHAHTRLSTRSALITPHWHDMLRVRDFVAAARIRRAHRGRRGKHVDKPNVRVCQSHMRAVGGP